MKKILLILGITLMALQGRAQEFHFGIKAGINNSNVFGAEVKNVDSRTRFVGGFFGELGSKRVRFQAELLYSQQGFEGDEWGVEEYPKRGKIRLDYLDIPLLGRFYAAEWFSLDVGYQLGVMLNTPKFKYSFADSDTKYDLSGLRSVNHALVLGGTFRLSHVDVSARYILGISNLFNTDTGNVLRSRMGQFTVGYRF